MMIRNRSIFFAFYIALGATTLAMSGCAAEGELDAEPDRVINEKHDEPELLPSVAPGDPSTPGDPNRAGVLD